MTKLTKYGKGRKLNASWNNGTARIGSKLIYHGAKYAYNKWKGSKSRSTKRAQSAAPRGITTYQTDVKQVYRSRRTTPRARKGYRRSNARFLAHELRLLPQKKYHYHGTMQWQTPLNTQGFFGYFTYGMSGNGGVDGSGDLTDLLGRAGVDTNAADAGRTGAANTTKYFLDTMTCRTNVTNTGTNLAFVEVYTCYCRRDIPRYYYGALATDPVSANITSFNTMWGQATSINFNPPVLTAGNGQNNTLQTGATGTPSQNSAGVTPFQFRWFCQRWKITDVKRFQISPGNSISFDHKDTKNRRIELDEEVLGNFAKKGWTKLYLFRVWGGIGTGADPEPTATQLDVEIEKDYAYKRLDSAVPELNYIRYTNNTEP